MCDNSNTYLVEERARKALPVLGTGSHWWVVRDQVLLQVHKSSCAATQVEPRKGGAGRGGEGGGDGCTVVDTW